MIILEKTAVVRPRQAACFVVDYDRLLPNGWPLLAPVERYIPRATNRNAANYVDRAKVLKLLRDGMIQARIAERLGCSQSTIARIQAAASDAQKAYDAR